MVKSCYNSELWGLNVMSAIENVRLFSLKKMLQVPIFTPNVMVYGDSGRYELRIHAVLFFALLNTGLGY